MRVRIFVLSVVLASLFAGTAAMAQQNVVGPKFTIVPTHFTKNQIRDKKTEALCFYFFQSVIGDRSFISFYYKDGSGKEVGENISADKLTLAIDGTPMPTAQLVPDGYLLRMDERTFATEEHCLRSVHQEHASAADDLAPQ